MRVWTHGFRLPACAALFILLALTGCATRAAVPERVLGSPSHHVENGLKLLEKGRLNAAHREFRMAMALDPGHAPAHRGDALVWAIRMDFESAFEACHRAIRHTTREELKSPSSLHAHSRFGSIRWDKRAWKCNLTTGETACVARLFIADFLNEYYNMGVAYKFRADPLQHDRALENAIAETDLFCRKALFHLSAGHALREMSLETDLGRGVALLGRLSRADAASLLVQELKLSGLPGASEIVTEISGKALPRPTDLREHLLKNDILLLVHLEVKGFALLEDGSFRPDSPMRRVDYAEALLDIISRIDAGGSILQNVDGFTSFEGDSLSPRVSQALEACVHLGIMEGDQGELGPESPLSGMEAAHSVDRVKYLLGSYR